MLFIKQTIEQNQVNEISNFLNEFDNLEAGSLDDDICETTVSKYITSLANGCYAKSVDDIANTKVGNKVIRKRNLQQVMKESFFYGANRFGNNFIA